MVNLNLIKTIEDNDVELASDIENEVNVMYVGNYWQSLIITENEFDGMRQSTCPGYSDFRN